MKFLMAWVFLVVAVIAVAAQNNGGVVITIVSPSTGANLMGVLSVDVTVSAPVTSLTAKLNKSGVLDPVATSAMTKSGNDHYIAIFPLPTVTASEPYSVTVSDGTVAAIRAFNVVPGSTPVDPQPPSDLHAQMIALIQALPLQNDANTKQILQAFNKGFAQLAPLPTPTGTPCKVVSATTVYASNGHYKVTLDCPQTIAPAPPVKGETLQVIPQALNVVVVK